MKVKNAGLRTQPPPVGTNPAKSQAGRKGGLATLERYGPDQLKEWGRRGGRPRSKTYDDIRRRQQLEQNNNHKEEKGLPGNLTGLRKLYDARCRSSGANDITEAGIAQNTPNEQVPAGKESV